ncbi:hypothetical protein HNR46_001289 [Haloferula luteola]|uniref:Uncharacterized protein n=1 Tax=Haloferula luteola TaxID=595692 RepID=A0A840UZ87_9BACT|nr:hypothetical protein [Haloferula luteola]MBB5351055.1 hypothetical protein [Haloferula luteola]
MMKRLSLLMLMLSFSALHAEEGKFHRLRVLTVGNRAPFKQEVRDGVRYEIDPPEGSLPPREISVGFVKPGDEAEDSSERLSLRLGEVSGGVQVTVKEGEAPVVTLRDSSTGDVWLKAPLGGGDATLLVVWRVGAKWDKVRFLALDESKQAVPAQATRVVNVCSGDVGVTWGEKKLLLKPGKQAKLEFPAGATGGRLLVQYPQGGGLATAIDTNVENEAGTLRQWVVFQADRKDSRQPVQVLPVIGNR